MKKKRIYLAGGMEASKELGAGWRKDITPFLEEIGFEVLNPNLFEPQQLRHCHIHDIPDYITTGLGQKLKVTKWHDLLQIETESEEGKRLYKRGLKYIRQIIEYDCKMVQDQTDVMLVFWDDKLMKGCGTQAEITLAYLKGIPVYVVATCRMPAWARGCSTKIELTWDAIKEQLKKDFGTKE
jgi:nucleoside 2-deoxyribosyltransferase